MSSYEQAWYWLHSNTYFFIFIWRWHQAITGTNVDLSSVDDCGIHMMTFSQEMAKICILNVHLKITTLTLQPYACPKGP